MANAVWAIDPGPVESGWVILNPDKSIRAYGITDNETLVGMIEQWPGILAIEMIASYGMPVGKEVFETCLWIGRYIQAHNLSRLVRAALLVYRKDVKMFLCGTVRAKDSNIRQALLDWFGPAGTKAKPGPTYGIKSHIWPALGVAVTALKQLEDSK